MCINAIGVYNLYNSLACARLPCKELSRSAHRIWAILKGKLRSDFSESLLSLSTTAILNRRTTLIAQVPVSSSLPDY